MPSTYYLNPKAKTWTSHQTLSPAIQTFHRSLPDYNTTRLVSLPSLASSLGIGHVLLKDESNRFGLPAFKIIGASWAVYRAVADKLGIKVDTSTDSSSLPISLEDLGAKARAQDVKLVACTEGNYGRAVARMGKYLGIKVKIFVPKLMVEETRERIRSEGAEVVSVEGNYADSVTASFEEREKTGALLVMDTGLEGYEEIPQWVVEGYSTMLTESDSQILDLVGKPATHAFVPVGVGSIAQAVTQHFKSSARNPKATVIAVEPDTAPCLKASLEAGKMVVVGTGNTIMAGMNGGTPSTTAWPTLKDGVDVAVLVTDREAHDAVQFLHKEGVEAGPCGASPVAALKRLVQEGAIKFGPDDVVILFCTEGTRDYRVPS